MFKADVRVLIIDDNMEYIQVVTKILLKAEPDLKIETANTGKEGLEAIYTNHPDLIICDLSLPDINGSEICFKVKDDPSLYFIPILVVTGTDYSNKLKLKLLEVGAEAFLTKPFGESEFIAHVRSLLRLKYAEDEIRFERDQLKEEIEIKQRYIYRQEERMALILSNIIEGIWDWDIDQDSIFLSPKAKSMLGYNDHDLSISTLGDFLALICVPDRDRFVKEIRAYMDKQTDLFKTEVRMCFADGSNRWFLFHGYGIWDENGRALRILGIQSDITESKENLRSLEKIALEDYVTRLPNRILFYKLAEKEIAQARRNKSLLGFLFIDLDDFKRINDDYGHQVGDVLLKEFADRLSFNLRPLDIVARFAGDEFLASLPGIHQEKEIMIVINRIDRVFQQPIIVDGHEFTIRFSVGGSIYPIDGDDLDTLLKIADTRMYEDKKNKKKGTSR